MDFATGRAMIHSRALPLIALFLTCCGSTTSTAPASDASADVGSPEAATPDDAGQPDATPDATPTAPPLGFGDCTDQVVPASDGGVRTLYERLGAATGIHCVLTTALIEQLKDPRQAQYFAVIGQPGHATYTAILDCTTRLIGSATGGPEIYPSTLPDGYTCRALATSHASLHVPNGVFNDMTAIVAAAATKHGIAAGDVTAIGALLRATRGDIVDPSVPDGGP
jgi:hypothetical protein